MPINAPVEYFKAEEKFKNAKNDDEKILALEEMIRQCPSHKGAENLRAQLRSKLSKLKKESLKKSKKKRRPGITKEGEAQVCLMGFTQSGKSTILNKLTGAKAEISDHPFTTTKPEVGMLDYHKIKIQLIEIPSTFGSEYLGIAKNADLIALIYKNEKEKNDLLDMLKDNFIRVKHIETRQRDSFDSIKEKIWSALEMIIVYTKNRKKLSPMALPKGSAIKDFAQRIHKDFIKHFRFARLWRNKNMKQVGLNYILEDGDVIELHMK